MRESHASPSLVRFLFYVWAWHSAKSDALDVLHISLQKSLISVMCFCAIPSVCLWRSHQRGSEVNLLSTMRVGWIVPRCVPTGRSPLIYAERLSLIIWSNMSASLSIPQFGNMIVCGLPAHHTTLCQIRRKTTSTARALLTLPISAWRLTILKGSLFFAWLDP